MKPEGVVAPDHVAKQLVVGAVVRRVDDPLVLPAAPWMRAGRTEAQVEAAGDGVELNPALFHPLGSLGEALAAPSSNLGLRGDQLANEVRLDVRPAPCGLNVLEPVRERERLRVEQRELLLDGERQVCAVLERLASGRELLVRGQPLFLAHRAGGYPGIVFDPPMSASRADLPTVLREWGRLGCIGFGGPPTHIALLRELCVKRGGWLTAEEFEDAIAACNLLPGPASTQLAIYCAWRVRGRLGAIVGGLAFIVPGLILILALAAVFLRSSPPRWIAGAAAGAGAGVAAVALQAGFSLVPASRGRAASRLRWAAYAILGGVAAATIGPWLVLVLLGCGLVEIAARLPGRRLGAFLLPALAVPVGGLGALAWVAIKVGLLSYGGGFVIIPLMQADAVHHYHWVTNGQFLNAVALGQITPGPVVLTVAVIGYAAAGSAVGCWRPRSRSPRPSRSSCSAGGISPRSAPTSGPEPSSTAQAQRRSARFSAPPSRSPWRSATGGR